MCKSLFRAVQSECKHSLVGVWLIDGQMMFGPEWTVSVYRACADKSKHLVQKAHAVLKAPHAAAKTL